MESAPFDSFRMHWDHDRMLLSIVSCHLTMLSERDPQRRGRFGAQRFEITKYIGVPVIVQWSGINAALCPVYGPGDPVE